jgi:hypothetical protein
LSGAVATFDYMFFFQIAPVAQKGLSEPGELAFGGTVPRF